MLQQPSTAQQVALNGGQAGAQADENLAATTIRTQPQAAAMAEQPQKQKRKLKGQAAIGGQETGSAAAIAKDNDKKKKRKKQKKHSDKVAGAVATDPHPVAVHAAVEEMPEAGVPAATQDADQAVAASNPLSDTTDAGALKSGQASLCSSLHHNAS